MTLEDLFTQHLPTVPSYVADAMASGLESYYASFKEYRDFAMNYDVLPGYQMSTCIMQVPSDQFWPYTPHFRKFMALAIVELFKTRIDLMGCSSTTMEQTLVFVDNRKHRWIVRVEAEKSDPAMNLISIYFPQPDTPIALKCKFTTLEKLVDSTQLTENKLGIIAEDIEHWNAEWKKD